MQVGDLVVRTYGEGQRPRALVVGFGYKPSIAKIIWLGTDAIIQFGTSHLEVIQCKEAI